MPSIPAFMAAMGSPSMRGPDISGFLGQLGRGGDSQVGHLTPGEFVVPRQVIDAHPRLMGQIIEAFNSTSRKTGQPLDWRMYQVGGAQTSVNPMTQMPEFKAGSSTSNDRDPSGAQGSNPFAGMDQRARPSYADSVSTSQDRTRGLRGVTANERGGVSFSGGPSTETAGYDPFSRITNLFDDTFTQEDVGTALSFAPGPIGMAVTASNLMRDLFGLEGTPGAPQGGLGAGINPGELRDLSPARREFVGEVQSGLTRPPEMTPPPTLNLSSAMTPLQQRAAIATRATQGSDSVYRSEEAKNYYRNLLQRSLMLPGGGFAPFGTLLPIDTQMLQQVLGLSYQPTSRSVLEAIAAS